MAEESKQDQENLNGEVAVESPEEGKAFDPETATKEDWRKVLAEKDEEIAKIKDRMLRVAADVENTRKRLERESSEGICYANEKLIRELLPILDNLERAIEHGEKDADFDSLLEGVRMTYKGFVDTLGKLGCTQVEALGKDFDPNYHEAMMQQESSEHEDNKVLQEFRKGYVLNDRLIRPSMVVVSKKKDKKNK